MLAPAQNTLSSAAGDDDRLDARMLEPQPLQRVVQLDVDAQVVGVQLQLVVVAQATARIDRHGQRRDRPVDVEAPVAVLRRLGLEAETGSDHRRQHTTTHNVDGRQAVCLGSAAVDLGIGGRWAIVCASSQGLGRACAEALAAEGVERRGQWPRPREGREGGRRDRRERERSR